MCYHVINRGNGGAPIFHGESDYRAFVTLMGEAAERIDLRIVGYSLMPNHVHLVLWPKSDGDLSRFMQWLMTAHVRRYHRLNGSSGHLWQGRFRAFPIQDDGHYLNVLRYVERNALRARLVRRAEAWPWSSLAAHTKAGSTILVDGPLPLPKDWVDHVNAAQGAEEVDRIRTCVKRGAPFGDERWVRRTTVRLGLEASLRPRGRPPKTASGR